MLECCAPTTGQTAKLNRASVKISPRFKSRLEASTLSIWGKFPRAKKRTAVEVIFGDLRRISLDIDRIRVAGTGNETTMLFGLESSHVELEKPPAHVPQRVTHRNGRSWKAEPRFTAEGPRLGPGGVKAVFDVTDPLEETIEIAWRNVPRLSLSEDRNDG